MSLLVTLLIVFVVLFISLMLVSLLPVEARLKLILQIVIVAIAAFWLISRFTNLG